MSTYGTYFNNILTTTTSKYSQLRQKLTNSEADGETEDDSHISRVLREYYTEKGGRWPEWLGADSRAPVPVVQSSYGGQAQQGFVSSSGGAQGGQAAGGRWARGGLSDLWDSNGKTGQAEQEPASLRARAGQRAQPSSTSSQLPTAGTPQGAGAGAAAGRPFARNNDAYLNPNAGLQARPLPSQRAGSYQTQGSTGRLAAPDQNPLTTTLSASATSGTASDRLKQRLWGAGGSASPTTSSGRASPTMQQPYNSGGGYNNNSPSSGPSPSNDQRGYDPPSSSYSRYDSPSQSNRAPDQGNPYADARSARSGGGTGVGGGYSSSNPYDTGSASGRTQGGYGGGPYAQQQQQQRGGLPTGPRPQR